jgi:hypothetical protein
LKKKSYPEKLKMSADQINRSLIYFPPLFKVSNIHTRQNYRRKVRKNERNFIKRFNPVRNF